MSVNKDIEKRWLSLIKSETQKSNWKFKQYFCFKVDGIFLFDTMFWVNGKTNSLNGVLHFKPSDIDNLFWELTDSLNLNSYPLSLKVEGSHIIIPISYYHFEIEDLNDNKIIDLINTINSKVIEIKQKFTDKKSYYDFIKSEKKFNEYGYLTNLLYLNKYKELIAFINYCIDNNITSGISFYKGNQEETYFERIKAYLVTNKLFD